MRLATEVAETEKLFETLANRSPVGICIIQDGKFCYINPAFQSSTGYSENELVGRDSLEIVFPEDREQVRENAIKMLKGKFNLPYQFRVVHKDGSIHWVIESVASVQYRGRQATLGNFVDITVYKHVEEDLQTERNKLQSLIDAVEYTITIQDRDYNIIYQNEPSRIASGGDHLGEKCYRAYEGREKVCDGCPVKEAFKDGKSHTAERKTVISGKAAFWENTANPIRDAKGNIVSCIEIARDITERKQAEETLKLLSSVTEQVSDATLISDADFNITYANKAAQDLFGYSPEEMLGKHMSAFNAEPLPKSREQELEQTLSSDKPWTGTIVKKRKDGSTFLCECHITPLHDDEGNISSYIDVMRDVTECKEAEEALQAERNKLQSVIDAMEDGFNIMDRDYNIIYQNEPSKRIWGECMGEKCYRIYEGRENICEGCPVEKAFEDGKSHTTERKTVTPSGEVIIWENTANPVRDARGEITSCLEIGRNITELKRQEQALADELAQHHLLIDKSLDGIVVLDEDARVVEANEHFADMLGYTLEEVYKLHTWDWDKNFPPKKILEMGRNVDEKGLHLETKHTRKDGSVIDVDISISGIMYGGRKLIFCIQRDITERKEQEQALADELTRRRLLVDQSLDGIVAIDENDKVYEANQRFADMLGYTLEEVYKLHTWDWDKNFPPEQIHEMGRKADEKGFLLETTHTCKDGSVIDVDISINASMVGGQKLIFCVCRDVTERKKAEQTLADELAQRSLLIDKSLDGIVVLDEDAKVVEANQRFADMLGYTLEEVYKLHTWDWDKNFPREKILGLGRNVDEKGLHLETKHTRKDGSVFDVDISISGIMCGGRKLIFCIGRDVTERNRAEEALKNSEESYRELANSITDVFFAMDKHMRYTYWNKASEILTGVRAEDALGKSLRDVFPDSPGLRMAEKAYRTVLRTKKSQVFVNDFDINGRQYIFEISAYPARGGVSVFARDITESTKMEEAINLQRAYFQQLFDNSPDAILMTDINGKVIQSNRGFEVLFGYNNEEIKGQSLIELIVLEENLKEASNTHQRIFSGEVIRKESVRRRKDGSLVDVSMLAYPIRSNGKFVAAYGLYSDITERKRAEEALKLAAEEWRGTFDSISEAISIHNRDFRIQRANKAFAEIFKMKPKEIIGKRCYELHSGDKPVLGCPHKQTLATGQPAEAEFYESNLGKYLHESTSPIFNEKGEVIGTVHMTRDITAQKQQSERLLMADRLASIGELAAGTAHELNNPLTSVIGFSQLVMEKDIPDDIREDMQLIHNEAQRAANVTKNLLTFARKRAPSKQLNQINNIIEDVLKLRDHEHELNSIEVKRRLAPDLPEIMVDYFQMQQVFLNIIINAEYFMTEAHKGGTLTIATKKHNDNIRISITDDGPGIPPENLSRIFDPFFTTKVAGKGTGLGLSICHGIVSEHGGQIYAKNQPGKGATIFIELPINGPQPNQENTMKQTNTNGNSTLVVEDENELKAIIKKALGGEESE